MRIAVERDGRVLVSEQFGESPDVHAAFQRARGEGMTEGVESLVRYAQPRKQQRETPLIGAHGDGCLAVCYDCNIFLWTLFVYILQAKGRAKFAKNVKHKISA